jgi:hypothetical protein
VKSRAHAREARLSEADRHIDAILELIGQGVWGAQRLRQYCREHHLNYNTASGYSSQAWRIHKKLRGDDGEYRERLLANLDFAARWSRELDDVNAYIKAQDSQSKLLVQQPEGSEELTEEQLDAMIRARGYRKDTDATEPAAETRARRGSEDSEGEPGAAREGNEEE